MYYSPLDHSLDFVLSNDDTRFCFCQETKEVLQQQKVVTTPPSLLHSAMYTPLFFHNGKLIPTDHYQEPLPTEHALGYQEEPTRSTETECHKENE